MRSASVLFRKLNSDIVSSRIERKSATVRAHLRRRSKLWLEHGVSEMRTSTSIPRIYADDRGLKHGELTDKLIGIFFNIYNELGHGFLESVYEQAFSIALAENGIFFQRQIAVPVWYHEQQVGDFRADLLVEGKVIIELKTGRGIDPGMGEAIAELFEGYRD